MAILICSCVAFAGVTDIVANAFGLVISGLANAVLGLADYVIEPLFTITRMNTVQIVSYLPGFNDADGSAGSFFSQAIAAIAYMIAGTLIICRIITYFVDLANGEKLEPISRLIWNAIFGIILTVAGKSLLTLFFNRIIAPLSGALVDGMIGEGGVFSFATTGKMIANLGDATETYQITELPKLLVVVFLMLLIAWNLVKLALECAERYNSNKTGVANMLADQNIVPKGTKVKGFSSENGKLYANTYKKDNAGGIHRSKVELKSEGGQLRAVGASSKLDVSPDGKSATLKTEKGTYKLTQKDSDRRDGKELWEATKVKDENDADILKENQIPQQFLTSKKDADNDDDSSAKAAAATFTDDKNGELSVEGMLNEKMKENEPLYVLKLTSMMKKAKHLCFQ